MAVDGMRVEDVGSALGLRVVGAITHTRGLEFRRGLGFRQGLGFRARGFGFKQRKEV